jgi:predicted enzyme related to lactoylglutathione lyase
MSVRRIVPNINSADPKASKPFYEKVLGLDTAMDMGWIHLCLTLQSDRPDQRRRIRYAR